MRDTSVGLQTALNPVTLSAILSLNKFSNVFTHGRYVCIDVTRNIQCHYGEPYNFILQLFNIKLCTKTLSNVKTLNAITHMQLAF